MEITHEITHEIIEQAVGGIAKKYIMTQMTKTKLYFM